MNANEFISQHLFDGKIELEIIEDNYSYLGKKSSICIIMIDHDKLNPNSPKFDEDYLKKIIDIDNGVYNTALSEIVPMVGFSHDPDFGFGMAIKYKHKNVESYNEITEKIISLGYDCDFEVAPYAPWVYFYIDCDSNSDIEFIIETLEKWGYDCDHYVFSDDY